MSKKDTKGQASMLYITIVACPVLLQVLSILYMDFRFDTWKTYASQNQLPQQYEWVEAAASTILLISILGCIAIQILCGIRLHKMKARYTRLFIVISITAGVVLGFINFAAYVALY